MNPDNYEETTVKSAERGKAELREAIAEVRSSREIAQKAQRQGMFSFILRLLRLFAAALEIASGD